MSSREIPISIEINGQSLRFRDVHKDFSQTTAGNRLNNNPRYKDFIGQLGIKDWQNVLGFDVNNLEHGRLTQGIVYCFINNINQSDSEIKFTTEEQKLLLLTAVVHDWPEGFTKKGDISYERKNENDEKEELALIEKIITEMLGPDSLEISIQIKNILEDKNSKLGMTFNAIERIGYLRTALIAWKKSKNTNEATSSNLVLLTNNVFLNTLPKTIEYSSIFSPVKDFLNSKSKLISDAFTNMPPSIFDNYKIEDQAKNIAKFNQAQNEWNEWIGKF